MLQSRRVTASSQLAAALLRQDDLGETDTHVYELNHCYTLPKALKFTLKYVCPDGEFKQELYEGENCTGQAVNGLGGTSPWTFGPTTWECKHGLEACTGAWQATDVSEATS